MVRCTGVGWRVFEPGCDEGGVLSAGLSVSWSVEVLDQVPGLDQRLILRAVVLLLATVGHMHGDPANPVMAAAVGVSSDQGSEQCRW